MGWTVEQQAAIDARDCNLLISAAAGSGKTSVLVERIVTRVLDPVHPIDIDSIVVVTFTTAAASEMKDRLLKRLQMEIDKRPNDRHLIRQMALVDHARICTIDSFCSYVLRNYYNVIDLDPAFRIGEEGELKLLQNDVFHALTERYFEEADPDFLNFVDAFSTDKKLTQLYDHVIRLYEYAQSTSWPEKWLLGCLSLYEIQSVEELLAHPLLRDTMQFIRNACRDSLKDLYRAKQIIAECSAVANYEDAIDSYIDKLTKMCGADSITAMRQIAAEPAAAFKSVKENCEEKKIVTEIRDRVKKRIEGFLGQYLAEDEAEILNGLSIVRPYAAVLAKLTLDFSKALMAEKEQLGILSFSDIEHMALRVLRDPQTGNRTEVAKELSSIYEEIYIDEYQDSSFVQEAILTAVSRVEDGAPNIFMVGDVKQSIYRFRQARPEIFNQKYKEYTRYSEGSFVENEKYLIELGQNFRSAENVLTCINDIFFACMHESVGDIEYTDETKLNFGGNVNPSSEISKTEVLMIDSVDKGLTDDAEKAELCAHVIANRILELQKENPGLKLKDIAILLRSVDTKGPQYASVLAAHGIGSVFVASKGYFAAMEIQDVTNYLTIIDNPRQDIPLAGVMRSFFAYFTAEELAKLKFDRRNESLYDCLCEAAEGEDELGVHCRQFLEQLEEYRRINRMLPICELLNALIYRSGFYDYVGLLDAGNLRKANLRLLVDKAEEFEKGSYSGLFRFLKYIEDLKAYKLDQGEAAMNTEQDDAVRIMTIHKSKGLEFPVVFLGDAHSNFSSKDGSASILMSDQVGVVLNQINPKRRTKRIPPVKRMMQHQIDCEAVGEEIRILYVALTRAVNKFIVVGSVSQRQMDLYMQMAGQSYDMNYILENRSYMSMIAPVAMSPRAKGDFVCKIVDNETLLAQIQTEAVLRKSARLADYLQQMQTEEKDLSDVQAVMEYQYPYQMTTMLRSKYSVSDLKHAAMEENENLAGSVVPPSEEKPIPSFMQTGEQLMKANENAGTIYGNAYHKFFELLDYNRCQTAADCAVYLKELVQTGRMQQNAADCIEPSRFEHFLKTDLGKRMGAAALRGELFREQPFIMEVDGSEVAEGAPADEKVLIQGIIDAFFYEGDDVYIVDYKTDHVDSLETLVERYQKQLILYEDAISKVTGKTVKDSFLYSTRLGKAISIHEA